MLMKFDVMTVLAQQGQQGQGSWLTLMGMVGFFFIFMYLFTIRPRKNEEKKHQEAISRLKKGDEVMLESGIYGEVFSMEKDTILIKIAEKVVIKVHHRSVRVILTNSDKDKNVTKEDLK